MTSFDEGENEGRALDSSLLSPGLWELFALWATWLEERQGP
jgi:hypothetical protein